MPETGYYEKRPRPEQRAFFVKAMQQHNAVSTVIEIDEHHFVVKRFGKHTLNVYLTNKYLLSVADVMEILEESDDTDCIVSTMGHNKYSREAKDFCRGEGVGLFVTPEFLGAVNYDGARFLGYVPPKRR